MLRRLLLCVLIFTFSIPSSAGGGITWFRGTASKAQRALAPQEAQFRRLISLQIERSALQAAQSARTSHIVRLAHTDREAFYKSPNTLPFQAMATLTAPAAQLPEPPDPLFALRNDQMAFAWFETIEKDLSFLQEQYEAIQQALHVKYRPLEEMNYAQLIPPTARKIFVGEEHNQPVIYQAFENMVLQYKQLYPQRKIILLTEFVSDRLFPWQLPGRPVRRLDMPLRRNNADFAFFNNLLKAGIQIIGLENVDYMQEHEALITPSDSQSQSVYGMQERNAHWRRIISYVAEKNPDAILFIYAGTMHTHYRAPFSLATPSPQNFVMQWDAKYLAKDMPFGYVMQQEPFSTANESDITVLSWPSASAFSTRSGFDTCLIFPKEDPIQ